MHPHLSEVLHDSQRQSQPKPRGVLLSASADTGSLCARPSSGVLLHAKRTTDRVCPACNRPAALYYGLDRWPYRYRKPTSDDSNPHSPAAIPDYCPTSRGFLPRGLSDACPLNLGEYPVDLQLRAGIR